MTAEPGGEVLSCINTYRYPCPTPAAEGGQEQKGHLCTPFSPKGGIGSPTVDQKSLGTGTEM